MTKRNNAIICSLYRNGTRKGWLTTHVGNFCPLQVISWIMFTGIFSYVKVVIGSLLHEAGYAALLWFGIFIQAGSLIGALTMFPLVNVYHVFSQTQECIDNCN